MLTINSQNVFKEQQTDGIEQKKETKTKKNLITNRFPSIKYSYFNTDHRSVYLYFE